MAAVTVENNKFLKYSIYRFSSYASDYVPSNIMHDRMSDLSSRWSSSSFNPPQYLTLKLEEPSIVKTVKFGKYEKHHICNIKTFKMYGGLTDDNMVEILDDELKNDHVPEVFHLKHQIDGNYFPCRYIKIVPLESHGRTFNFCIWYVQLNGSNDSETVQPCMDWFNKAIWTDLKYRDKEATRLCLKFFRQKHYTDIYQALKQRSNIELEHPTLTELHRKLVNEGEFETCETLMEEACSMGLFNSFLDQQDYKPKWTPIEPIIKENRPGMRGGHQMCIDTSTEIIYMFGGWDGNQDLADLWAYNISCERWICLSKNAADEGGPSARSCHKMCIDSERKQIFTVGRYLDSAVRTEHNLKSDFYMYDIITAKWTMITEDTASMGGPHLVFDHQIVMDTEKQCIYVFGGRILSSQSVTEHDRSMELFFSGLYSYHVPTNTWTKLRDDCPQLRSRIGHSMLFHAKARLLYIFAGQRAKEFLNDFVAYNVDTDEIYTISDGSKKDGSPVPAPGFTQRATIDPNNDEIHVFSGLSKDKEKRENARNSFWVYNIPKNRWSCIYRNENTGQNYWTKMQHVEPMPRYAHQLVYDYSNKMHYLFGGNPGKDGLPKLRLDDFWSLKLSRPSAEHLLRRCRFMLRRYKFEELAVNDPHEALHYLQTKLFDTVDHDDPQESKQLQALTAILFKPLDEEEDMITDDDTSVHYAARTRLFDQLSDYFPSDMTQPKGSLVDLIALT